MISYSVCKVRWTHAATVNVITLHIIIEVLQLLKSKQIKQSSQNALFIHSNEYIYNIERYKNTITNKKWYLIQCT